MSNRERAQRELDAIRVISETYPDLKNMTNLYTAMMQAAIDNAKGEDDTIDMYSATMITQATNLFKDAIMSQQMGAMIAEAVGKMNADLAYGEEPGDDELAKADLPESLRGLFK